MSEKEQIGGEELNISGSWKQSNISNTCKGLLNEIRMYNEINKMYDEIHKITKYNDTFGQRFKSQKMDYEKKYGSIDADKNIEEGRKVAEVNTVADAWKMCEDNVKLCNETKNEHEMKKNKNNKGKNH